MRYVICSKQGKEVLYWNNEDGWGGFETATKFADTEWNLPIGGEWVGLSIEDESLDHCPRCGIHWFTHDFDGACPEDVVEVSE